MELSKCSACGEPEDAAIHRMLDGKCAYCSDVLRPVVDKSRAGKRLYDFVHDPGGQALPRHRVVAASYAEAVDAFRLEYPSSRIVQISEIAGWAGGDKVYTNIRTMMGNRVPRIDKHPDESVEEFRARVERS